MTNKTIILPQLRKIPETLCSMAQKGQLPAFKVGGLWQFKRADLVQWSEHQRAASCDDRERA
jgi:excisionase family DNA binding protein